MSMAFAKPFNRTSMELKPVKVKHPLPTFRAFNRTSMELKLLYPCEPASVSLRF